MANRRIVSSLHGPVHVEKKMEWRTWGFHSFSTRVCWNLCRRPMRKTNLKFTVLTFIIKFMMINNGFFECGALIAYCSYVGFRKMSPGTFYFPYHTCRYYCNITTFFITLNRNLQIIENFVSSTNLNFFYKQTICNSLSRMFQFCSDIKAARAGQVIQSLETRKQARDNKLIQALFTDFQYEWVNILHFLESGSKFFCPFDEAPFEVITQEGGSEEELPRTDRSNSIWYGSYRRWAIPIDQSYFGVFFRVFKSHRHPRRKKMLWLVRRHFFKRLLVEM